MEKENILGGLPGRKISDYYNISKLVDDCDLQELGKGTYGQVFQATVTGTKIVRAIKMIPKEKVTNVERFKAEVDIMKTLVGYSSSRNTRTSFGCTTHSKTTRTSTSCSSSLI